MSRGLEMKPEKYVPILLSLLLPFLNVVNNIDKVKYESLTELAPQLIATMVFLYVLWQLNWFLSKKKQENPGGAIIGNGSIILVNVLYIAAITTSFYFHEPSEIRLMEDEPFWAVSLRLSLASIIFLIIQHGLRISKQQNELKTRNATLQSENLKFQLETLTQQVNPHFLFNSLNTLLDLVEENQAAAAKYVRSFSNLYRVVLQSMKYDFVSLGDEVRFLNDYWMLLKTRFQDSIHLNIDIQSGLLNHQIPPLSLQLLVENAVKHNEATEDQPLKIHIKSYENLLIVENNLHPKRFPMQSEKVGLINLQKRYELLYRPITYEKTDTKFIVKIPLKSV